MFHHLRIMRKLDHLGMFWTLLQHADLVSESSMLTVRLFVEHGRHSDIVPGQTALYYFAYASEYWHLREMDFGDRWLYVPSSVLTQIAKEMLESAAQSALHMACSALEIHTSCRYGAQS
ncbi:hypothetical protein VUR80DRAFT_6050 [Thermomyces stellatus]